MQRKSELGPYDDIDCDECYYYHKGKSTGVAKVIFGGAIKVLCWGCLCDLKEMLEGTLKHIKELEDEGRERHIG